MLRLVRTALTGALIAAGLTLAPPPLNPLPIASAEAAALSAEDRADVARVEAYLNGITSMKSSFLQSSSTGHVARGPVWLRRPGRLRLEYDPPPPIHITADGVLVTRSDMRR